ncbi:MAG: diguanylate cyclase [Phycisphaerae bacterium]
MTRLKLTSPGVLLILAVVAAAGIFLLDLFYLCPYIDAQKWAALREEAVRAEHGVQLALQAEQRSLVRSAAAWARSAEVIRFFQRGGTDGLDVFLREAMAPAKVQWSWLTDPNSRLLQAWPVDPKSRTRSDGIASAMEALRASQGISQAGLIRLPDGPALYARYPVRESGSDANQMGYLCLARTVDSDLLDKLSLSAGGRLVLIPQERPPRGVALDSSARQTIWLTAEDHLAVAWVARDPAGKNLGYFLATVPVVHIHRQALSSRRMVLIILSLSVALTLLVILGSHMLITGPVVRLLSRLQRLESGEGSPENLARDLHGEPLMLARRLENAFEKLAHISKTDELTGLANRRHFSEVLDCFYVQARRYNRPLSLIVMDVDYFKAVNDAGGHQVGDEVLKWVSAAIEEACRRADLPARFGGDEFAVLLPETSAEDARAVAERIRVSIGGRTIHAGNLEFNVTVSGGIADLNAGEMDGPDAMLGLADQALYAAKQLGRNRILLAHDVHAPQADSDENESKKINVLSKKLAGLDDQFKDLFVQAFKEVMLILQHRDPHMADHTRNVLHYATLIAREMELPSHVIKRIEVASVMHDLGMVAMPDSILLCPTQLDEEELRMMRRHPLLSVRIMQRMDFLDQEIPAVRYHHERWDGKGYPEGIAGASIPLTARVLAVADAFDAITSPRTFRNAKSCAEALGEIHRAAGTQFDPTVVEAFMLVADRLGSELMHITDIEGDRHLWTEQEAHFASPEWRESAPAEAQQRESADS